MLGLICRKIDKGKTFRNYWSLYGGWKALLTSRYFYAGLILTALCTPLWTAVDSDTRSWAQAAIEIIPSLMGFSLGGMAIMLAFSDRAFLNAVQEEGEPRSLFMIAVATFFHFILLQSLALIFALISKAYSSDVVSFVGFFFLSYGTLTAIAVAGALLNISRVFNMTASAKRIEEEGKTEELDDS